LQEYWQSPGRGKDAEWAPLLERIDEPRDLHGRHQSLKVAGRGRLDQIAPRRLTANLGGGSHQENW
jgi:hypothetical protein